MIFFQNLTMFHCSFLQKYIYRMQILTYQKWLSWGEMIKYAFFKIAAVYLEAAYKT